MTASYRDIYGLLHHIPNPSVDSSENAIYYTAEYVVLYNTLNNKLPEQLFKPKAVFRYNQWQATSVSEKGSHFSHDNAIGAYVLKKSYENLFRLPAPRFRAKKWSLKEWYRHDKLYHPRHWCLEGMLDNRELGCYYKAFKAFKNWDDPKKETSGNIRWFMSFYALYLYGLISEDEFKKEVRFEDKEFWKQNFFIYFQRDIHHPIVDLAMRIWA